MSDQAMDLHRRSIVIDGMGGTPCTKAIEIHKAGGVTAYVASIASVYKAEHISEVMLDFSRTLELLQIHARDALHVETAEDIERAHQQEKVGLIFGLQGLTQIGRGLHWLQILHKIGLRIAALTYNESNFIGCPCCEPSDTGLTYYGSQVVREMNRLGILVDLSHVGVKTSMDAIRVSTKPVVLSHSNPRRLVDHPRNVPDDLIKAVADTGGVIGVSQYAPLLDPGDGPRPTIETWLDHIDYAVNLVGIDHVGFGTDCFADVYSWSWWASYMMRFKDLVPARYLTPEFEGVRTHDVEGFDSDADMPKVTRGLLARGYPEEAVRKVLGLNLLRVCRAAWAAG